MFARYGRSVAHDSGLSRCQRLRSGVDYSPVVNNSRIEWTHQLEDACYLVVGTNKYWFDCFISRFLFHLKGTFFNPKFSMSLESSFCAPFYVLSEDI